MHPRQGVWHYLCNCGSRHDSLSGLVVSDACPSYSGVVYRVRSINLRPASCWLVNPRGHSGKTAFHSAGIYLYSVLFSSNKHYFSVLITIINNTSSSSNGLFITPSAYVKLFFFPFSFPAWLACLRLFQPSRTYQAFHKCLYPVCLLDPDLATPPPALSLAFPVSTIYASSLNGWFQPLSSPLLPAPTSINRL